MSSQTFTLADSFDATFKPAGNRMGVNMAAPLPLGYAMALECAKQKRNRNPTVYTWRVIAENMLEYHGWDRSPGWWAAQLRGQVKPTPRNRQLPPRYTRAQRLKAAA